MIAPPEIRHYPNQKPIYANIKPWFSWVVHDGNTDKELVSVVSCTEDHKPDPMDCVDSAFTFFRGHGSKVTRAELIELAKDYINQFSRSAN